MNGHWDPLPNMKWRIGWYCDLLGQELPGDIDTLTYDNLRQITLGLEDQLRAAHRIEWTVVAWGYPKGAYALIKESMEEAEKYAAPWIACTKVISITDHKILGGIDKQWHVIGMKTKEYGDKGKIVAILELHIAEWAQKS